MKKFILILFFTIQVLLHMAQSTFDYARYDNYYLYRISIENKNHVEVLNALENYSDSYIVLVKTFTFAEVIVPPHKFGNFHEILTQHAFQFEILSENVQNYLNTENTRMRKVKTRFDWLGYYRLDVINDWMKNLMVSYPRYVTMITVGQSYEGRQIHGIKLSYKKGNPAVIMECGIHAREWISPAVGTYILNELICSKHKKVRSIAERYDWYIIPVANPDGYEYTHTKDRLWRKTRKPYTATCIGADPNRNWDNNWGTNGTSTNPCTNTFPGDKPFSETEIKTISKFLKSLKVKIVTHIAIHSYSQLLMFPHGYTTKPAPNHKDLQSIGHKAIKALAKRYETMYKTGPVGKTIYPVSGTSNEWAYNNLKTKLAFVYELRPSKDQVHDDSGFILPAKQIIPTGKETLDSLVALLDEAKRLGY